MSSDNAQVEGHIIPVIPKVGGYVATVGVDFDQHVKAGQTLVTLDARDFQARLDQADADLAKDIASAGSAGKRGQAQSQLAAASATETQAQASATPAADELSRYRNLAANNIISGDSGDRQTAAHNAQAALDGAREQVSAAEAGLTGAGAHVAGSRAAREQASLQLSYTTITAPSDGVVSKKSVEVGQLVQPGQPLMTIVPLNDIWVVANLKETEIRDVAPGNPVAIHVDAYPGQFEPGRGASARHRASSRCRCGQCDRELHEGLQRIPVRIAVDTAKDPAHPLRPGMSVDVVIKTK